MCSVFCIVNYSPAFALDWKRLHEYADALSLQDAVSISLHNPDSLESLYVEGLVYLRQYDIDKAEGSFRRMQALDASSIESAWGIAECLRRRRDYPASIRALAHIVSESPNFSPAYITLAYIHYLQRDFERAAALALTVVKQGAEEVDHTNLVRGYSMFAGAKGMIAHYGGPLSKILNGRMVLPYLRKAERIDPESSAVLFGLGNYYLLIPAILGRNPAKAEEYFLRALKADPLFADVYARLAQVYKLRGEEERYREYIRKTLELDPGNEVALDIKKGTCLYVCVGSQREK
ncbi:MAG: tetratricopeptide repeat protein [Candidatus Omnitrophica bacterium]|nr:tetratricopeptide repeat protein [Candidatus Omnitrophota bacterium]